MKMVNISFWFDPYTFLALGEVLSKNIPLNGDNHCPKFSLKKHFINKDFTGVFTFLLGSFTVSALKEKQTDHVQVASSA